MARTRHDNNQVAMVIGFYFIVSLGMVLINKVIMLKDFFPYPIIMTWFQLIIQLICVGVLSRLGQTNSKFAFMPPFEFKLELAKIVMPVTILYVSMIIANNVCLHYVEVSFYQAARSLTILFTILFTYLLTKKLASQNCLIACGVVIVGYFISAITEINVSIPGLIYGVLSSVFVSLYGISVKSIIEELNDNHWRLLMYNSVISVILMIPFVAFSGELKDVFIDNSLFSITVWLVNIIGGIMGFLINVAIFLQIKYTSPLTNNIIGTVKATVLTILALITFRNPATFMNILGILLVIGGSGAYTYFRSLERTKSLN